MNDLFTRAPCFGGRGFDSAMDLTLPERIWWTRASEAESTGNIKEATLLVQESRTGRNVRGFVLDPELALLDQEITEMWTEYHLETLIKSTTRLALDNAERAKLKSTMLMEKLLLRSCSAPPPIRTSVKELSFETKIGLEHERVKIRANSIEDIASTASIETQIGLEKERVKFRAKSIEDIASIASIETQIGLENERVKFRAISIEDIASIASIETQIGIEKERVKFRAISIENITSTASIETQIGLENVSLTIRANSIEDIASNASIETIVSIDKKKKKISFKKRVRSFMAKLCRSLGSCVCCGRRRAAAEE